MHWTVQALITFAVVAWILSVSKHPRSDDTDPPGKHSGLILYTDHKTGIQYVATPFGGLTPRINEDGTPMRAGKETP